METVMLDLRYALRMLRRSPAFVAVAVVSLALGIGGNLAIFGVVNAVLLRPLPFPNPDRLVRVFAGYQGSGADDIGFSEPEFEDVRDRAGIFDQVTVVFPASAALSGGDHVERVELLGTSPNYFQLLGAAPQLVRVYTERDARPGFSECTVISDALWRRQFGGAPDVIGRVIRVDEDPYTIVGVMPPDFRSPSRGVNGPVDVWVAAGYTANPFPRPLRGQRILPGLMARLRPRIPIGQAQTRLNALAARLCLAYPKDYPAGMRWTLRAEPVQQNLTGNVRPMLIVLLAAVGFVLLIVCANLASLLLARSSTRVREFAIRQAIGASRRRLVRQVLTESVLISLAGGFVALLVLWLLKHSLVAWAPADLPRLSEIKLDAPVVALAFALSLGTGLLFGLTPALHAAAFDPNRDLKEGGRGAGAGRRHNRFRSALVAAEITLSIVLLTGAGLLVRSFWNMLAVNPGMDPRNLVAARIWIPVPNNPKMNRYLSNAQREVLIRELVRRATALPDVSYAAVASGSAVPFLGAAGNPFAFSWPEDTPGGDAKTAEYAAVTPDHLRVLKTRLIRGRFIQTQDSNSAKRVAVVDEIFVRKFSPHRDVVGRRFLAGLQRRDWEIVGVIGDLRGSSLDAPVLPHVYFSSYQNSSFELAVLLRTAHEPSAMSEHLARAVHAIDPELPVYAVRSMNELVAASMARRRFSLMLMGAFAFLALCLAAIGIYGLMAYAVSQRSQEFGVRMALGAGQRDVLAAALTPGVRLLAIGILAGLLCAAGATRMMSSLLFGVSPNDAVTFAAVPILLGAVALLACFIPARRATRISPVLALRY